MTYTPPRQDIHLALETVGLDKVLHFPPFKELSPDLVDQILDEAGKLAQDILVPLNVVGDRQGCKVNQQGEVKTPDGWPAAYRQFVAGGWNGMAFDPIYGGQGLPWLVATAAQEMWKAANLAFSLCALLNQAGIELLSQDGTLEQKQLYLHKITSGEWTTTMNLTEPQAGTDLGAIKTKAVRHGDHYLITGQKIFITYGEHDLSDNIIHMILARTPDAPAGSKGISLFLVPKVLVNLDGSLGDRNDLRCVSLEHKLGIHGSPTAVMSYGDHGGAIGYLIGEENKGLSYMFTMMNNARLSVGIEGVGMAERAYQKALSYAYERIQGKPIGLESVNPLPIAYHPDIARMLQIMKAKISAMRLLAYETAFQMDKARSNPDAAQRHQAQTYLELLIPVTKAWCTDSACEITSLALQVHGGMGYIEETGAAQYFRDSRISPIYEGTNGVQANDLVGRKIGRDQGQTMMNYIKDLQRLIKDNSQTAQRLFATLTTAPVMDQYNQALETLATCTDWIVTQLKNNQARVAAAASVPYLHLCGLVISGGLMIRQAIIAQQHHATSPASYWSDQIHHCLVYLSYILPDCLGLQQKIYNSSCLLETEKTMHRAVA